MTGAGAAGGPVPQGTPGAVPGAAPQGCLGAGAVARRLGIAITTLRTWHQRYGLGPSGHMPGRHRRYTPEDLARLEVMRRLTAEGVPPATAACWAQRAPVVPGEPATPDGGRSLPGKPAPGGLPPDRPRDSLPRDGGGRAIAVGRAGPAARGLARAALRLDVPAMREMVARSIAAAGVVSTWDSVLRPVLVGVGDRHAATGRLVEVEHLLSRSVSEILGAVPRPPASGPPVRILLACADEEQHSLPLEALAAALAEAGVPCRQLGARVPHKALADTVVRTGPMAVVLWAHAAPTADPAQLYTLLNCPARPMLVAACGPGWQPERLPPQIVSPATLAEAVRILVALARA